MQACKYCQSTETVKQGVRAGIQRYLCKACEHHFFDNRIEFVRMRTNQQAMVTALNLYFDGLSTGKVVRQLEDIFVESVSQSTVWYWIQKYSEIVSEYIFTLKPQLSGKYHHDETEFKVGGEDRFFWEMIDRDTRYLVASLLTETRNSDYAKHVFRQALAVQRPRVLFTDGSFAYDEACKKVFCSRYKARRVEWIRRVGIRARFTNNMIERQHGTLKDRLRPMRGLKQDKTARTLLRGYVINYNY